MKEWTIDEFLQECESLCRNPYTYDYSRMPEGICNGHRVKPFMSSWHSIVIDGGVHNMAVYNDKWPNGNCVFQRDGVQRNALEDVRHCLERNAD